MVIVSDTSCISNLFQIRALHFLPKLFGEILIPNAVFSELLVFHEASFEDQLKAHGIKVIHQLDPYFLEQVKKYELDLRETEAIALALQLKDVSLIIDEKAGKKTAKELGIKTVGLLGVILLAKEKEIISLIKPFLDELRSKTTFRYSNHLYDQLLQLANEQ